MLLKNISLGLALCFPSSTNAGMFGRKDPAGILKSNFQRRSGDKIMGKKYRATDKQNSQDLDNLLEKLKYHGCQCSRFFNLYYDLDLEEALIGGDHTVDELDAVCLDWYRARNCIETLPPAEIEHSSCSCTPNVDDVVLEMNDQGECVTDGYGPCSGDTCEIDAAYSNDFIDVVMNILGEKFTNETDFSKFEPQIVNEIGVCPKNFGHSNAEERVCTGTAPNFVSKRVSSANHPRKRREVNEDCDPAMVELLGKLGSCSFGYAAAADGQCVKNVCTCENGLAVDLCDAAETAVCQSCDAGYNLNANQQCIANCDPGWDGEFCENNIDECISNECVNGSACVDGVNGYTCSCATGYDGQFCENNIDDCASNACANGSCVDGIAGYTCSCDDGWEGQNCETLTAKKLSLSNPRFGDGLFLSADYPPERAIDGIIANGNMAHSFYAFINPNYQNPTFLVDLEKVRNSQAIVETVIIYPRQDSQYQKYSQLKVRIDYYDQYKNRNTYDNNYCEAAQSLDENTIKSLVEGGTGIVFQCNTNVRGSTIIVENTNDPLHFAEIEAYGFEALSLSNPRFSDGTYMNLYSPEQAIDGRISNGNMAHSLNEQTPTFLVDLPNSIVGKLIIYPRQDTIEKSTYHKYSQMKVRIDNNDYCKTDQSLDENTIHSLINGGAGIVFQCNIINGSTIIVEQHENHYLHLAEIEAFGFSLGAREP